jgi:hypothetical protein
LAYLPQSDEPAPLDNDYLDPPATLSGRFGSYVLALKLNVDFTDARLLAGTGALLFGDLLLADTAFPLFNGSTVREYLGEVNGFLGGAPAPYAYDDIASLTDNLSLAFEGGTPTPFAEDHLEVDRPAVLPEPSTIPLLLLAATMLLVHRRSSAPTEAV